MQLLLLCKSLCMYIGNDLVACTFCNVATELISAVNAAAWHRLALFSVAPLHIYMLYI